MATPVFIRHTASGVVRKGYYGFSWTYLFFGWFVPLIRGELVVAALHLVFTIATAGLWQVLACFIYNRQYMTRRLTEGWVLADTDDNNRNAAVALGVALAN